VNDFNLGIHYIGHIQTFDITGNVFQHSMSMSRVGRNHGVSDGGLLPLVVITDFGYGYVVFAPHLAQNTLEYLSLGLQGGAGVNHKFKNSNTNDHFRYRKKDPESVIQDG
jgi:hypothetical protein